MTAGSPTTPAARCTAPPRSSTRRSGPRPQARPRRSHEIPGWECCGNTAAHARQAAAGRRPAGQRARQGQERHAARHRGRALRGLLQPLHGHHPRDEGRAADRADMERVVGRPYAGGVEVATSSTCTTTRSASTRSRRKVGRPFGGLKVAAYYGCLLTRPPKVTWPRTPSTRRTWTTCSRPSAASPSTGRTRPTAAAPALALCEQACRRRARRAR